MICYDIVNPSDATTLLAPDRDIALAALVFIGGGMYGGRAIARNDEPLADDESADLQIPPFISGLTVGYDDWWRSKGYTEEPVAAVIRDRKDEVIAALRSTAYGDIEDRRTYQSALDCITDDAQREKFKRNWEDRRRSSLNRIVQRAWALADALEKQEAA